jgi:hypothetical protein
MMLPKVLVLLISAIVGSSGREPFLSCETCKEGVGHALEEWGVVQPGLVKDLPRVLCSSCPVSSSCEALVAYGIAAFSEEISHSNETVICEHLGLCNDTTMIA